VARKPGVPKPFQKQKTKTATGSGINTLAPTGKKKKLRISAGGPVRKTEPTGEHDFIVEGTETKCRPHFENQMRWTSPKKNHNKIQKKGGMKIEGGALGPAKGLFNNSNTGKKEKKTHCAAWGIRRTRSPPGVGDRLKKYSFGGNKEVLTKGGVQETTSSSEPRSTLKKGRSKRSRCEKNWEKNK